MFRYECPKIHTGILFSVIILALLLVATGCQSLQSHLDRGEELLKKRRYQEAEIQFRAAIEIDDNSAAAHWGLARTYEAEGKFAETTQELKRVSDLAPENLEAKTKLGNYYLLFNPPQTREAEITLDDILKRDPKYVEAHILRASILSSKNKPEAEVMQPLDYAISLDRTRTESYLAKARFLMKLNNPVEAEDVIKQGIDADPKKAIGYIEYGRYLNYENRPGEAEQQYKKAVQVDGKNVEAWQTLGSFYVSQRKIDEAEKTYQGFVKADGNSPESRMDLGGFYRAINRDDSAIKVFDGILAEESDYALARYQLAEIYLLNKNYAKADEQINYLLDINDSDNEALMLRARMQIDQGETEKAVADLEEVLKKQPSLREALFYMAQARLAMGQADQAQTFVNDLDKFHPGYEKTALLKIQLAFLNNEPQIAIDEANKLINESSNGYSVDIVSAQRNESLRIRGITSRGVAYMMMGDYAKSEADLGEVVRLSPGSASAKINLARLYTAKNNLPKALELYDAAIENDANNFDAFNGAISILTRQKNFAEAKTRIAAAEKKYPNNKDILPALNYMLSDVFVAEGNINGAIAALKKAMEINPDYLPAYSAYASILFSQNKADEALAQYKTVVEKKPSASVYSLMGMVEDGKGNFAAAENYYRKALELSPTSAIASNNLAWLIADTGNGNLDEALKVAQDNVERNKNVAGFYDTLAWVNFKKGFYPQAVEASKQAVALDEQAAKTDGTATSPGYRLRLGMALTKSGEADSGKREIATALRAGGSNLSPKELEQAKVVLAGS
ncbi:MAG: tetratricopeptide repeat protein [Pyrinomonadaceae bacterium]